jgi:hypothetical protein
MPFSKVAISFDPIVLANMHGAFDAAWESLVKSGSPLAEPDLAEETRAALVGRIIETARHNHDLSHLRDDALAFLANTKRQRRAV